MANNTAMLQKCQKKVVLLVFSAISSFVVSANPVTTSDDWEDWVEQQAQIEQAQLDITQEKSEESGGSKALVQQAEPPCPHVPYCKG